MPVRILEPRREGETDEQYEARREAYEELVREDEQALAALRRLRSERVVPPERGRRRRW